MTLAQTIAAFPSAAKTRRFPDIGFRPAWVRLKPIRNPLLTVGGGIPSAR